AALAVVADLVASEVCAQGLPEPGGGDAQRRGAVAVEDHGELRLARAVARVDVHESAVLAHRSEHLLRAGDHLLPARAADVELDLLGGATADRLEVGDADDHALGDD